MLKAPTPANESARLEALRALAILDTPTEERFDRLTRIAQHILQVPIVLISLVDAERQWFKSRQGLDAGQTPRDISFCGHAIMGTELFVVPDASVDPRFADNPLVTEAPNIAFYAGAPLTLHSGQTVGTLCAIDREPRQLSQTQLAVLNDLALCVIDELERVNRLRLAADLALAQTKYAAIIESSADAIISKTLEGIITSWNPAAEALFGYTAQQAIGQPMTMLIPADRKHEEPQILARIRRGECVDHYETVRVKKDGQSVHVSIRISPLHDADGKLIGASKIAHDISGRVRAEQALKDSAQLVTSIVETVADGIITIDGLGKVRSFNSAAARLFGYDQAEVIGTAFKRLMPERYAAGHEAYLARNRETHETEVVGARHEVVGLRKDGSMFPMELAVTEMRLPEQTLYVGTVRDITERKEVDRLKAEFVSSVSHELRTPLTSIRGALGLVIGNFSADLPDVVRQLLDTANGNSQRLNLLIDDILDFEKMKAGQLEFEFGAVDLAAVTRQAITANENYGRQHNVQLQLTELPKTAMVWADAHRLQQVFANLISNAVKFSAAGGVVQVTVRSSDGRFRVSVKDSGRGIPKEFHKRVFQRFAQADSSDSRQKGGTGLGLAITMAIIDEHGGSIDFSSEEGLGAEFFFELPEWRAVAGEAAPPH